MVVLQKVPDEELAGTLCMQDETKAKRVEERPGKRMPKM
jgi:hypothetical protein